MIYIHGKRLTKFEKTFLRKAINFTMDYLFRNNKKTLKRVELAVFVGDRPEGTLKDVNAYCYRLSKNRFQIWASPTYIKRGKKTLTKYKHLLSAIFHELVHLKQYATGELEDVGESKYKYKGQLYNEAEDEDEYFESPHEIEAYGREIHLLTRFSNHWKKLVKEP